MNVIIRLYSVSILVLMEYDLKAEKNQTQGQTDNVSILVLMEYDLKDTGFVGQLYIIVGFNPCSNGI